MNPSVLSPSHTYPPRILMVDAHGFDGKSNDAMSFLPLGIVIFEHDVEVIVNEGFFGVLGDETDGETAGVMCLMLSRAGEADGGTWHVVDDPIVVVAVLDVGSEGVCLDLG